MNGGDENLWLSVLTPHGQLQLQKEQVGLLILFEPLSYTSSWIFYLALPILLGLAQLLVSWPERPLGTTRPFPYCDSHVPCLFSHLSQLSLKVRPGCGFSLGCTFHGRTHRNVNSYVQPDWTPEGIPQIELFQ